MKIMNLPTTIMLTITKGEAWIPWQKVGTVFLIMAASKQENCFCKFFLKLILAHADRSLNDQQVIW